MGITEDVSMTALSILYYSWWYVVGSTGIYIIGSTIDIYIKEKRFIWRVVPLLFIIIAAGFIGQGVIEIVIYVVSGNLYTTIDITLLNLFIGSAAVLLGSGIYRYIRDHIEYEAPVPVTWQR